jgi:magnesium chelatase family protein
LSYDEAVEATQIHSVAGLVDAKKGIVDQRPFRSPHHTVSEPGLVGGGEVPRPGEITLAHHGVLFLDELAEFRRSALEAMRQPLEDGVVSIVRARARATYPARPLVIAAVNPCPCGYLGHPRRECRCSAKARQSYLARLSGPLLDRLDLHVRVPPVPVRSLTSEEREESSVLVRSRVLRARLRQRQRFQSGSVSSPINSMLSLRELGPAVCVPGARALLESAVEQLGLSARAFVKVLRVARTIADLEECQLLQEQHVAEAIQGRLLDQQQTNSRFGATTIPV